MSIEQIVSAALVGLHLGRNFTYDDLLHRIQDRRQRRLRVVELADLNTRDGVCAVWFVTGTDDIVLHARSDSALHRQQFILHELAHIILGHCNGDYDPVEDLLLPNIPLRTRVRILKRQDTESEIEVAAESLADRLAAGIRGSLFAESRYSEVFG